MSFLFFLSQVSLALPSVHVGTVVTHVIRMGSLGHVTLNAAYIYCVLWHLSVGGQAVSYGRSASVGEGEIVGVGVPILFVH